METTEVWKEVPGYEGKYKVSDCGRVISINGKWKGERVLEPASDPNGYLITSLRKDGIKRYFRIHQLVAMAFIAPPTKEDNCVNHKDGNKKNNHVTNLEWVTRGNNIHHALHTGLINNEGERSAHAKLTDKDVLDIRQMYFRSSAKEIGGKYNISRRHIGDIVNGVCWKHLPVLNYSGRQITKRPRGFYTPKKK